MTKSSSCCTSTMVRVPCHGDANVLELVNVEVPAPGPGEVSIKQRAVEVNYFDIYMRMGLLPLPLPSGLGTQAAGEVLAVGDGVSKYQAGGRGTYATSRSGAYAQRRVVPSSDVEPMRGALSFDQAARLPLRGLTAQRLLRQVARTQAGDRILFTQPPVEWTPCSCNLQKRWVRRWSVRSVRVSRARWPGAVAANMSSSEQKRMWSCESAP